MIVATPPLLWFPTALVSALCINAPSLSYGVAFVVANAILTAQRYAVCFAIEYFLACIAIVSTQTLSTYTSLVSSAKSTDFPTSDDLGACAYTFV